MRKIDKIIVHCSATAEGRDFTVADLRRWHVEGNKWSDIGYHYIIHLDGTIHIGRPVEKAGAHTAGHNMDSIGVCYIGGLAADGVTPKDTRTPEQKEGLIRLLRELLRRYPNSEVYGHHDFDPEKACPCFDARNEYKEISSK